MREEYDDVDARLNAFGYYAHHIRLDAVTQFGRSFLIFVADALHTQR